MSSQLPKLSAFHTPPDPFSPPASFPFMFLLHTTAKHSLPQSHQDITHCIGRGNLSLLIIPITCFFSSHTFGLPVAAGEKHSTMPPLISFSLYFQSYCPLNTAQGFFYKPVVGLTFLSSYRTTPA